MVSRMWRALGLTSILVICGGVLFWGAIALAQSEKPVRSSETPNTSPAQPALTTHILAPDDNGYTGPRQAAPASGGPSSEGQLAGSSAPTGPEGGSPAQPDEDRFYAPGNLLNQPAGWSPNFYYLNLSGATLRPRTSTTNWAYAGGGCEYFPGGVELSNINVDLPDKSRIDYLRLFYYDVVTPTTATLYLTSYDGAGNFKDLTHVSPTSASGYGSVLSGFISVTVDASANSYVLNWDPGSERSSKQRICGARIAYRLPLP